MIGAHAMAGKNLENHVALTAEWSRGVRSSTTAHKGRPKKPNVVRDRTGKSRGEIERVDPAVLAVRARHLMEEGISGAHASDALAGFTLGRLLLRYRTDKTDPSGVSQEQYDAGDLWCKIVHRHAAVMGYKLRTKTPSFIMVSGGLSCGDEPDQEAIIQIRRRFSDCYNALTAVCRDHGIRVRDVTYGVCVENWPMNALYERDYGDLKIGLNVLGRALR